MMPRAAVLWAVFVALGMGGCGDEGSSEGSTFDAGRHPLRDSDVAR